MPPTAAAALEDYLAALELDREADADEALYTDSESQYLVQAFWQLRGQELEHLDRRTVAQLLLEADERLKEIMARKPLDREAFYRASLEQGALKLLRDRKRTQSGL